MAIKKTNPTTLWLIIVSASAFILVFGYFAGRKWGVPLFKQMRQQRLVKLARGFAAEGKNHEALLTIEQSFRDGPGNVELWKFASTVAEKDHSPEAIYYIQLVLTKDKNLFDELRLIKLALSSGYPAEAVKAIDEAGPEVRDSAEFHRLAAQVYSATNRLIAAKYQLYSYLRLSPNNPGAEMDLAQLNINDPANKNDPAPRERLFELAKKPAAKMRALGLLLDDAVVRKDGKQAQRVVDQLRDVPTLTPVQKVRVLEGLDLADRNEARAYRQKLEVDFANVPAGAAALLRYDLRNHDVAAAETWMTDLPDKTRSDAGVQQAMAGIYFERGELPALGQMLLGAQPWGPSEYVRQAYLAYVARATGRFSDGDNAWRLAMIQAGKTVPGTIDLMRRTEAWGWNDESYQLFWKLYELLPHNVQVRNLLINWEQRHQNTVGLNRLFGRMMEDDPRDQLAKNNYAYTSLLLGIHPKQAFDYAKEAHETNPASPFATTNYALALDLNKEPSEALKLMNTLTPVQLSDQTRTLYKTLFQLETGDPSGAAEALDGISVTKLLPEERTYLARAREDLGKLGEAAGLNRRLTAQKAENSASGRLGWLHLLPPTLQAAATPQMAAADTLFASGDMATLQSVLKKASWDSKEYFRLMLLAYTEKKAGDEQAGRDEWRTAVLAASDDPLKLENLAALAKAWGWEPERIEALDKVFTTNPSDVGILSELLAYYRPLGRTTDMARVLNDYVSNQSADADLRGKFAYFSMLCNLNLSQAYVTAKNMYDSAPDDASGRAVFAFSLWKQKRLDEALQMLVQPSNLTGVVPANLLRAAVYVDLKRDAEATRAIDGFKPEHALPEEIALADSIRRTIKERSKAASL